MITIILSVLFCTLFVFVFYISDTVIFENRYEKLEEKIIDWLDNFDDEIKPKIINFWYKFWK